MGLGFLYKIPKIPLDSELYTWIAKNQEAIKNWCSANLSHFEDKSVLSFEAMMIFTR